MTTSNTTASNNMTTTASTQSNEGKLSEGAKDALIPFLIERMQELNLRLAAKVGEVDEMHKELDTNEKQLEEMNEELGYRENEVDYLRRECRKHGVKYTVGHLG